MKRNILILACIALTSLIITSCGNSSSDPFAESNFNIWDGDLNKRVEAYFDGPTQISDGTSDTTSIFIDFSNGLIQAYIGNSQNAQMLEKITQKLTGNTVWYGMGRGEIYKLDFPTTELFNKVTNPKSYESQMMAPIELTLKKIISSKGDALLVTDFEEYTTDGKEQFENFAKGYFQEWLLKGNSIDFIITNYQEKTKDKRTVEKHLYFIVFSYGSELGLLDKVNYALLDRGFNYQTFSLSTKFYSLMNEYAGEHKGGNYYNSEGKDIVASLDENNYVNGLLKKKSFEFYPFQQPWADIYSNTKSLTEAGVDKPFTDFFRSLFIDASKEDVFQLKGLDIVVSDITDDFEFFTKANEVKNHQPKLGKDSNGNTVISSDETDPIALACYNPTGEIKPEWVYASKPINAIKEVFVLNTDLFNNGLKNSKDKIELGIKYHNNFNASQISNPNGLLRVDVVISECSPNFNKLDLFKWESTTVPGKTNDALSEAIRNTLDEVNPKGKVIYSYFIKTVE